MQTQLIARIDDMAVARSSTDKMSWTVTREDISRDECHGLECHLEREGRVPPPSISVNKRCFMTRRLSLIQ
jgi:hypothetical protein